MFELKSKRIISVLFCSLLLWYSSVLLPSAKAEAVTYCYGTFTSSYLGSERATIVSGAYDLTMSGYIYYDASTSQYLTMHSMAQVVTNHGTIDIDSFSFRAQNHNYSMVDIYTPPDDYRYICITTGQTARVEADWHAVASGSYSKGSTSNDCAFTEMAAFSSESFGFTVAWQRYWLPNNTITEFVY